MKKRIKYAVITILAVFIAVNIADFIMFQRFKSICKQEMSILNREDLKLYLAEDKRVNVKCYGESPFLKHWIGNTDG